MVLYEAGLYLSMHFVTMRLLHTCAETKLLRKCRNYIDIATLNYICISKLGNMISFSNDLMIKVGLDNRNKKSTGCF